MVVIVTHTPVFERLSTFSLASEASIAPPDADADAAPAPPPKPFSNVAGFDEDENIMEKLSGLRSLSVSTDASESRDDDIFTLGGSPELFEIDLSFSSTASKRSRGSDFDDETLLRLSDLQSTPPKAGTPAVSTPETISFFADITPPTPPRRPTLSSHNSSPESPGGVAARRARAGKLPNKALASLQKMRFDCHDAGMGLGVGPGSPGFVESMEVSTASPGPGMAFRLALGLTDGKDVEEPEAEDPENTFAAVSTSTLASPSLLRHGSGSSNKRRTFSRSPPSPGMLGAEAVRIPPTLRGSKILEKLNLSSPPTLTSPLSMSRGERAAPPSPLLIRTSAFAYSNTGPLTPLTPSHVPGAPSLGGGSGGFDWCSYSQPDSPNCPIAPQRAVFLDSNLSRSPRQPFFLPTPPSDAGRSLYHTHPQPAGSPLAERRQFFT